MSQDFLIEIGTQELPPKALLALSESFAESIRSQLKAEQLSFSQIKLFATPRRLAVLVESLDEQTPQQNIISWGPPKKVAFDRDGNPSKAAQAFAKKNKLALNELTIENDGKADKLVHRKTKAGRAVTQLLEPIVNNALDKLPIPKRMRWGENRIEFVRPVQWVLMMFGNQTIDANILGVKTTNLTRGHRFHCNREIEITKPGDYQSLLATQGHVIADFSERHESIRKQVKAEGEKMGGLAVIDDDLLNEVTGLVEWPISLTGSFDKQFLDIPPEALIYSMKEHQKYFHIENSAGKLMPHFITVSNIDSNDPAQVIHGNERVIRPRLSDAAFFYETDKKVTLASRIENLRSIVFQEKLGTLFDKAQRIKSLALSISEKMGGDSAFAARAGELCKADLLSDMVLEFDKMQGIAGFYYAASDGEPEEVAQAIRDHYLPKFSGDALPSNLTACAVALADRLDTIVGIFGIGQKPSGSRDPFALRRASLGVLRIIVEKGFDLDLKELLELAVLNYGSLFSDKRSVVSQTFNYMVERFRARYEEQGIPAEVFISVSAKNLSHPLDIDHRVQAVSSFTQLPEAQALAAANKRVSNILAKQTHLISNDVNSSLLKDPAEITLASLLQAKIETVAPLYTQHKYKEALASLADLRQPVDNFFEDVMVMVDEPSLKNNRLALLNQLRNLFLEVADISLLVPAK